MRRKSNALADYLANLGVNSLYNLVEGTLQDPLDATMLLKCRHLARYDLSILDAGDNKDAHPRAMPRPMHLPRCKQHVPDMSIN